MKLLVIKGSTLHVLFARSLLAFILKEEEKVYPVCSVGNLAEGHQEGGLQKVVSEASGGGEAVLKALVAVLALTHEVEVSDLLEIKTFEWNNPLCWSKVAR